MCVAQPLRPAGGVMDHVPRASEAVERLKNVFLEIPGTQLSAADAARCGDWRLRAVA